MKPIHTLYPVLAALVSGSTLLEAQGSLSGTTSALASAFSLRTDNPSTLRDEVYVKAPTSTGGVSIATATTVPGARSYPLSELAGSYAGVIRFASFSSGCSQIPHRGANGSPDLAGAQSWMLVVASVDDATVGAPGSLIAERRAMSTGRTTPGADFIGYYMNHSVGLSEELRGDTRLEMYAEGIGLGGGGDVDALDYGMGVITHAQSEPQFVFFVNTSDFYFTLDKTCLTAVDAIAGSAGFAGGKPASASTIYKLDWLGAGAGWSGPSIYRDAAALGIPDAAEIDAVAVDPIRGNVVFSTTAASGLPQLLFQDSNYPMSSIAFVDGSGTPVPKKIGTKSNDVTEEIDGVDILDPEASVFGKFYGTAQGTIKTSDGDPTGEIGLSMTRSMQDDTSTPYLHFQATGWGDGLARDGYVVFEFMDPFTLGPGGDLSTGAWSQLSTVLRTGADYEVDLSFQVPPQVYSAGLGVRATAYSLDGKRTGTSVAVVFVLP